MAKKELYLVTGGAGFIGSHIVEALLKRNQKVRVFDNLSSGLLSNIEGFKGDWDLHKGDLRREADVRKAVRGVGRIFHLAACRAVLRSVEDPMETNDVNISGTLRLLIAARDAKVARVVSTSSSSVYGNTQKFPSQEEDKPMPQSPYAATKITGEYFCRQFSALYGLSTVSLRYFNVFGPRQNPESIYSAVIPIFINCIVKHRSPEIHWDGKQSRDFSYVDNVVEGNMLAMSRPGISGEVFNIACHEEHSVLDMWTSLCKILNVHDIKPVFKPKRSGDIRRSYADISKAKRLLGYKVRTRFYPGLVKTVEWFLAAKKK